MVVGRQRLRRTPIEPNDSGYSIKRYDETPIHRQMVLPWFWTEKGEGRGTLEAAQS